MDLLQINVEIHTMSASNHNKMTTMTNDDQLVFFCLFGLRLICVVDVRGQKKEVLTIKRYNANAMLLNLINAAIRLHGT